MAGRIVSQRTIIELKNVLGAANNRRINYADVLYANDFPDWFVIRAQQWQWRWIDILLGLRRGGYFFNESIGMVESIIPNLRYNLPADEALALGEAFIRKLAAYGCSLSESDTLLRSLQLDGFDVDKERLRLVPLGGSVSEKEERDRLTILL